MSRGRGRKIEVPTDTQPQFDLGNTAEDIESRRRKREEREEMKRQECEEREVGKITDRKGRRDGTRVE